MSPGNQTVRRVLRLLVLSLLVGAADGAAAGESSPFEEHLQLAERVAGVESHEVGAALENLGDLALVEGRLEEAENFYLRAGKILRGHREPPEQADSYLRWSLFYFLSQNPQEGRRMFQGAGFLGEGDHPTLKRLGQLHFSAADLAANPATDDREIEDARSAEMAAEIRTLSSELRLFATLDSWRRMTDLSLRVDERDAALGSARKATESYLLWRQWTPEEAQRFTEHLGVHFQLAWTDPGTATTDEEGTFRETFALAQHIRRAPELAAAVRQAAAAAAVQETVLDDGPDPKQERLARDRLAALAELEALEAEIVEAEEATMEPAARRRRVQSLRADVEFVRQRLADIEKQMPGTGAGVFSEQFQVHRSDELRRHLEEKDRFVFTFSHANVDYYWLVGPEGKRRHRSGLRIEAPPARPGGTPPHPFAIDGLFGDARRLFVLGAKNRLTWNPDFTIYNLASFEDLSSPQEALAQRVPSPQEVGAQLSAAAQAFFAQSGMDSANNGLPESLEEAQRRRAEEQERGERGERPRRRQLPPPMEGAGLEQMMAALAQVYGGDQEGTEAMKKLLEMGLGGNIPGAPRKERKTAAQPSIPRGDLPPILPQRTLGESGGPAVLSVAFHPNGGMVTSHYNGSLRLWDTKGFKLLEAVDIKARVEDLVFTQDGSRLAGANLGMMPKGFITAPPIAVSGRREIPWKQAKSKSQIPLIWLASGRSTAWSPEGRYLYSSRERPLGVFGMGVDQDRDVSPVRRQDLSSGAKQSFIGPRYTKQIACSGDGRSVVTGNAGGSLSWWDPDVGDELAVVSGAHQDVGDLAWSPNSQMLASGGSEGEVKLWRASDRELVMTLQASHEAVTSLAWSADGRYLASSLAEGGVLLWDAMRGKTSHWFAIPESDRGEVALRDVAFTPRSDRVVATGDQGRIYLWNLGR